MKVNFYDVVDVISGGTPRTDVGEFWNGEIPWLSVVDFAKSVKYVYDTEKHITELGLKNSNTKLLNIDDIIISARGTVGAIAMLKIPMAFNQSCFGLRAKREFMNQDYLFYFLKYYMENLKKKTQGSVFSTINLETFRMIDFELPDTNTQIKISKILSCLDSKIENNNKINAELESMAKTLYDYWFLQFEFPNENGKPYKSSGGKMVWNEELKREIPEGWTESTLSEISNMYQPNTFDAKLLEDDGKYRVYGAGGYMGQYHDFNHKESEIFISCRGSCGDIYRSMPFSLITGNAMIVHPNNIYLFEYLYLTLQRIGVKNCITGSVQPQITRTSLNDWKLVVPSEKVVRHFKSIVEPIFKKQETIIEENSKLNSLRDFLLPMLMNGQISFNK